MGSRPARASSPSGRDPAQPIAMSPGPAAGTDEAVGDHHAGASRVALEARPLIRRAEASQSSGGSVTVAWLGQVRGVDAGVGADPSVFRLGHQQARLCPDHVAAPPPAPGSTIAGSLPSVCASRCAGAGRDLRQAQRPPLGLGDDLLRDDNDFVGERVAEAAIGPRGRRLCYAPPNPGQRPDPQLAERRAASSASRPGRRLLGDGLDGDLLSKEIPPGLAPASGPSSQGSWGGAAPLGPEQELVAERPHVLGVSRSTKRVDSIEGELDHRSRARART